MLGTNSESAAIVISSETPCLFVDKCNSHKKQLHNRWLCHIILFLSFFLWEMPNTLAQDVEPLDIEQTETVDTSDSILEQKQPISIASESIQNSLPSKIEMLYNDSTYKDLGQKCINFYLNSSIHYTHIAQFKKQDALNEYIEGWFAQLESEKMAQTADSLRKVYESAIDAEEQQTIAQKVLNLESQIIEFTTKPSEHYDRARNLELSWWEKKSSKEIQNINRENSEIPLILDKITKEKETPELTEPTLDTSNDILDSTNVEIADETIESKEEFPEEEIKSPGVIYKVQIGTFTKTVPPQVQKKFDQLAVLRKIDKNTDEKGTLIFSIGELKHFNDAVNLQNQIRQEGIKDAFVVAYLDGKRITLSEAKKITE